ncbi:MAG TPA: type 4a pilus biogenesis protein PilO [Acidimicrobiales bacterium]|nr:type 4a pilus biogenesis protein PilO [Acidimicrobiales bacterium]
MNRRTILVAFAAAVVLLLGWFMLLWGPQGGRLSDARDRIDAAENENRALELRLSRLQAVQERAPELTAALSELRRAVPDDPALAQLILDANQAANESGVEFLSIAPSVPAAGSPATITLSINVTGTYEAVLLYLRRLEELPRIIVVDTLSLSPSQSEAGLQLSVSLTARMFTNNAEAIAGPEPEAADPTATTTTGPAAEETITTTPNTAPEITVSSDG